jgi:predicted ester cyclase
LDDRGDLLGGDRVVVRWTGTGTQVGEINGVPATASPIRVDGITIHRMSGGKIAETWQVWDTLLAAADRGDPATPGAVLAA